MEKSTSILRFKTKMMKMSIYNLHADLADTYIWVCIYVSTWKKHERILSWKKYPKVVE